MNTATHLVGVVRWAQRPDMNFGSRSHSRRLHEPPFPRSNGKPPVPTLAFWSRRDGIVAPSAARGRDHEIDRAIEIDTYHVGAVLWRPALSRIVDEIEAFLTEIEGQSPIRKRLSESRH